MTMDDVLMTPERWQDRWEAFKNEPQQVTAIWKLYDAIKQSDPALLSESAEWASKFSEAPPAAQQQVIAVPYFCQLSMDDGSGWRDCFSTTAAMIAAWAGKVTPDTAGENHYNHIRQKHGDSTVAGAQVAALAELGLTANYSTNGTKAKLCSLIDRGIPVGTGILHHGQASSPTGGGHWVLIIGYDETGFLVNDPYGDLGLASGQWEKVGGNAGNHVHYSFRNFMPRWEVSGGDGYMLWVDR